MQIQELLKHTGLKDAFVRKCLREMDDVFKPFIKRGSKNAIIFDSNAVAIFDRIKHEKAQGYSLSSIKDILYKELNKQEKDGKTGIGKTGRTPPSEVQTERTKTLKQDAGGEGEIDLRDKLHQFEIAKINAENELEKFKISLSSLRLLQDGGTINDIRDRFNEISKKLSMIQVIVDRLHRDTWSQWLGGHANRVQKDWEELKSLVQECLKS